ncbi:MAG: DinB family protein [Gemmatimonadaceae bacterium]|nr:DinB family protein [Gemmatimonadaceae bacterium]
MDPMHYPFVAIADERIPKSSDPVYQHMLDTYVSETNKVASVWREFRDDDLGYRPHPRSTSVGDIFKHQLLSERRFFGEFIGTEEPAPADVMPDVLTVASAIDRLAELAVARSAEIAAKPAEWWLVRMPFFEVERERIWIFWRRVLHTAHHRTQLTGYLRLLNRPVPPTYGPTADVKWDGADPTNSVSAAGRKKGSSE